MMSTPQFKTRMLSENSQQIYLDIQREDWVQDLLNKLNPEERPVVLEALRDLKHFNRRRYS